MVQGRRASPPSPSAPLPEGAPRPAPLGAEHFREVLAGYMAKKGLRSTKQRDHIVEAFFAHADHVSIEELLSRVRERDAAIGYATVYRTLKLLTECGVAYERKFGDGLTRYELADGEAHHDHLICLECHTILEFEEPEVERLQDEIARRHGFLVRSHKHELYGVCAACQRPAGRGRGKS